MKKILTVMAIISILAVGAVAFAHGTGGWGGGNMMGGYGGPMMGQGYGGHMTGQMGQGGQGYRTDRKFLDETADLRKELHEKRFEYMEASRDPKIKYETLAELEKDIYGIQSKLREKAPRTAFGSYGTPGHCW